jgi:hypothetical protein
VCSRTVEGGPSVAVDSVYVGIVGEEKAYDVHLGRMLHARHVQRGLSLLVLQVNEAHILRNLHLHVCQ